MPPALLLEQRDTPADLRAASTAIREAEEDSAARAADRADPEDRVGGPAARVAAGSASIFARKKSAVFA